MISFLNVQSPNESNVLHCTQYICTNFLAYFAKCLNLLNYHGGGSMIINTFYLQVKGFEKITMYGIMYHIVLSS